MKWFALIIALYLMTPSQSLALDCQPQRRIIAEARFEVMDYAADTCWLSITADWEPSGFYRSFLFDEHGYIMIFNSLGWGDESSTTGAREYVFFPRSHGLDYILQTSMVTFKLPNGAELDYDGKALRISQARGIHVSEDPNINAKNNGGVELKPQSGLMVDFGFKLGSAPMGNRKGTAKIVDSKGRVCQVNNNELLIWSNSGDPYVKFRTDAEFFQFVSTRCPTLQR
jgi:hypothetical protein